jgi:hypothetical protein
VPTLTSFIGCSLWRNYSFVCIRYLDGYSRNDCLRFNVNSLPSEPRARSSLKRSVSDFFFLFLILTIQRMGIVRETTYASLPTPLLKSLVICIFRWVTYPGADSCYLFSEKNETWSQARALCNTQHASLVCVDDTEEMHFLGLQGTVL